MPLGIGATLTDAFNRRDSDAIDRIRECLSNGSAVDWYKLKDETEAVIFDKEIKQFTYIQQFLADSALGYQCLCTLSDVQRRRSRLAPVFGLPGAVAMFRALNAKRRIYALREKQKDLISEWGECILPAGAATEAGNSSAASSNNLSDGFADAMAEPAPVRQQFPNGG